MPILSDILQYSIEEKVCDVTYRKNEVDTKYHIQFFNISSAYGQWYATGYNFETDSTQVFRCDKVLGIEENNQYYSKPFSEFMKPSDVLYKKHGAIDFEVEISKNGIDLFHKEHYPSMQLLCENGQYFIRGFYNMGEETFITNYFMYYGEDILSIKPITLKNLIIEKVSILKNYFSEI